MNAGPTSPREPEVSTCGCGSEITDDENEGCCEAKHCYREVLCVGCAFDCADCQQIFCKSHICETSVSFRSVIYRCEVCQSIFEAMNERQRLEKLAQEAA